MQANLQPNLFNFYETANQNDLPGTVEIANQLVTLCPQVRHLCYITAALIGGPYPIIGSIAFVVSAIAFAVIGYIILEGANRVDELLGTPQYTFTKNGLGCTGKGFAFWTTKRTVIKKKELISARAKGRPSVAFSKVDVTIPDLNRSLASLSEHSLDSGGEISVTPSQVAERKQVIEQIKMPSVAPSVTDDT